MKRISFSILVVLLSGISLCAQTAGEFNVSVTTSSAGGNYTPRNILAIWIEDDGGSFVKTLLINADKRKTHLNIWQASTVAFGSEYNAVDAITGATNSNYSTKICSWDGTDTDGAIVPDGIYSLRMELTDKNSTGNNASFSFTKGSDSDIKTPPDQASFSSISVSWIPTIINAISESDTGDEYVIYPNPSNGIYRCLGENINEVEIRNIEGKLITKGGSRKIDISNHKNGIYLISFKTDKGFVIKKVIKK